MEVFFKKTSFFFKKICSYQKKAVPLHALLSKGVQIPLPAEAGFPD